jgi:hypothetical protein
MLLCSKAFFLSPRAAPSGAGQPAFPHLAEGLASADRTRGIEVACRMFSVPDFPRVCTTAHRAVKLDTPAPSVVLWLNQWFPLDRLVIMALDRSGRPERSVPIAVDVEATAALPLDLRSGNL